jgi:hypothetical protein
VFAAIALIAAAVAITWFAPTETTAETPGLLCIYARGPARRTPERASGPRRAAGREPTPANQMIVE